MFHQLSVCITLYTFVNGFLGKYGDYFYFFLEDKIANNRVIYSILTVLFSIFVLNLFIYRIL